MLPVVREPHHQDPTPLVREQHPGRGQQSPSAIGPHGPAHLEPPSLEAHLSFAEQDTAHRLAGSGRPGNRPATLRFPGSPDCMPEVARIARLRTARAVATAGPAHRVPAVPGHGPVAERSTREPGRARAWEPGHWPGPRPGRRDRLSRPPFRVANLGPGPDIWQQDPPGARHGHPEAGSSADPGTPSGHARDPSSQASREP
ncbi:hypothetical protein GCM10010430_67700 [Kitasatospora cystarginea]|uniref:Uncharacterized protein n=1 Tax=Kitasatospora cystarginea TaxID=58350 RepID=A0ABN3EUP7_9ACTN